MTLALVQAVMNIIIVLVLTWAGLLISVAFLLPEKVEKAATYVKDSSRMCFVRGVGVMIALVVAFVLASVGIPANKLIGLLMIGVIGGVMALGSAGLALMIGKRSDLKDTSSSFVQCLRGSLAFSLALGFPYIGWFVFAPIALMFAMGAGVTALLPEKHRMINSPGLPPERPGFDLSNS